MLPRTATTANTDMLEPSAILAANPDIPELSDDMTNLQIVFIKNVLEQLVEVEYAEQLYLSGQVALLSAL